MYNIELSFCVVVHLIMFEITALEFEEKSVQLSKACIRMHAFPKKQATATASCFFEKKGSKIWPKLDRFFKKYKNWRIGNLEPNWF